MSDKKNEEINYICEACNYVFTISKSVIRCIQADTYTYEMNEVHIYCPQCGNRATIQETCSLSDDLLPF
ncbi:MAG: hypothetical protein ACI35P_01145 [Bacillus sp. (in: firmicutes)]